jgi:methyl-accepting chemotaxis protein
VAAVGRIGENIVEIDSIASSIAAAVEQQGAATAEIARNIAQTARAADEMAARASEVSSEAEETNRQAGHVHVGATGLATAVGELKHTVMRVVRTSTSEVDRRTSHRKEISLRCRLIVSGQGVLNGRMVDLSEEGARLVDAPRLSVGTRGMLDVDGVGTRLPFTVRKPVQRCARFAF